MRRKDEEQALAAQLRAEGRTYDEIAAELGVSKGSLSLWLRDHPHPDPVRDRPPGALGAERPDWAGDVPTRTADRRELARELRLDGWLLREIAELLGISVRPVHRYVADLPVPARARHGGTDEHMAMMRRARWDRLLAERDVERQAEKAAAAAGVGPLSRRELHLAAVTAYWAEGCKDKPWRRHERVIFINSDEGMIRLWLAFLDDLEWPQEQRRYRVAIHTSADVTAATAWWASVVGVPEDRFSRPTLKRHNPKTVRHNTGVDYRGCLVVSALQARVLYQRIAGTWTGIVAAVAP
ncbi:MAG: hypothetical protein Q8R60_15985 [Mycobacteriales bacterium]|nr:hypothetical protein [Mycobacteriales bacterium]